MHRGRGLRAQLLCFAHVFFGYVAGPDVTSRRCQLQHQLTSYTGAATSDECELAFKIFHHAII